MKQEDIKSIHFVNGKKIVVLKEKEIEYKTKRKRLRKVKNYFNAIKNAK